MSDKTMGRDEAVDVLLAFMPKNLCLDNTNVPDSTKIPLTASLGELRRVRDALTALTAQPSAQPSAESMLRAFIERYESRYTRETMVLVMAEVTARARELDAAHPAPQQPEQPAKPELCGCGKPAEYMTVGGGWCCNKYGIKCRPEQPADKAGAVADEPCDCKNFCESHGREFVETTEDGEEYCHECSADGDSGELCFPMAGSCDMLNPKSNEFERSFMCQTHAAEHEAFCRESLADKAEQPGAKVRGLVEKWEQEAGRIGLSKWGDGYIAAMKRCLGELKAALSAKGEGE